MVFSLTNCKIMCIILSKFENRSSHTHIEFERLTMTEGNAFRTTSFITQNSLPTNADEGVAKRLPVKTAKTHCCYCAMQCQMELREKVDGHVEVVGLEHPINKNKLCVLGQNSAKLFNHTERLTTPLVRQHGKLVPTTWEEAMERAVAGFKFLKFKYDELILESAVESFQDSHASFLSDFRANPCT